MAKYYKQHVCVLCGCYYKAFSPNSTHCPDCIHAAPHVCLYCGVEFKARSMKSNYCDKHRYMQSPAYLANVEKAKREAAERRKERNRKYRESHKPKAPDKRGRPRTRPEKISKSEKVITEAVILEHKPVVMDTPKEIKKPEAKFFLKVGKSTYGFITEERLNRFKQENGLL